MIAKDYNKIKTVNEIDEYGTSEGILDNCTGIIVLDNDRVLLGLRTDGQGWSIAGGKMDGAETTYECAIRELEEEFGLTGLNLDYLGQVESRAFVKGVDRIVMPHIFLCKQFKGEIKIAIDEMVEYKWVKFEELEEIHHWFPPSKKALEMFLAN
ncbi:8-oxo-dGTP pyrophosphatase MutT (NUDIX family) [Anaerosolibacter carboniphilus]|uniref:8-oxo-dGTP pyrophosphatase MutT (NUDIX family) n=1 Tax=Anaerosolibacter carboniphilus TaxID=1417629 RepID=A0A841KWI4_9FIRM|nr:NUDIX domain-containing protein [Anaerosolibacter carboniphilus]MBB6217994.1 8-oxo-dGTP pyrophosphatase MutT (NUDIX family) [Anaerosolibacter carboniphilus]